MHPSLPPVYLAFWLLSWLQIAPLSQTCWLIFTPSNYCLPISNSQPLAYCFSLIGFDHFSSWVRVLPEAGRPPPPNSSITEWWDRGEVGGLEGRCGWSAAGSQWAQPSGIIKKAVILFHSLRRDWWRVWLMFTCISKTCESHTLNRTHTWVFRSRLLHSLI